MSTTSPNMGLPISTVGVDSGLNWEMNLNAALTLLDQHTHAPGSGIAIQPDGLNINSDLTFQGNSATNLKSAVFAVQTSVTTLDAVYVKGVDLYYRDGSNNEIRMTAGGSVNATTSGISSGSATASFVSSVLVVNSASNTPANIQGRSILLGNNVSGSNYVTLSAPAALASSYTLTLPLTPASTKIMVLDSSGNMSAPYTVDGTTIAISSNVIGVPTGGIGTTQLAAGAAVGNIASGTITGAMLTGGAAVSNIGYTPVQTVTAGTGLSGGGTGQTLTITLNTAGDAVGTYAMASYQVGGILSFGGTTAGSNLSKSNATGTSLQGGLSGTWRCMGVADGTGAVADSVCIFVRIS